MSIFTNSARVTGAERLRLPFSSPTIMSRAARTWEASSAAVAARAVGRRVSASAAARRAERNLFFICLSLLFWKSVIPQRVDGIEAGRLVGGQVAEEDADAHAHAEGDADGAQGGHGGEGGAAAHLGSHHAADEPAGQLRQSDAHADAQQAADGGGGTGLDDELPADVLALGAQGLADADLPGPLGDRDQHDVHDADAAHQKRDGGDGHQHNHHGAHHGVHGVHHLGTGHDKIGVIILIGLVLLLMVLVERVLTLMVNLILQVNSVVG